MISLAPAAAELVPVFEGPPAAGTGAEEEAAGTAAAAEEVAGTVAVAAGVAAGTAVAEAAAEAAADDAAEAAAEAAAEEAELRVSMLELESSVRQPYRRQRHLVRAWEL